MCYLCVLTLLTELHPAMNSGVTNECSLRWGGEVCNDGTNMCPL